QRAPRRQPARAAPRKPPRRKRAGPRRRARKRPPRRRPAARNGEFRPNGQQASVRRRTTADPSGLLLHPAFTIDTSRLPSAAVLRPTTPVALTPPSGLMATILGRRRACRLFTFVVHAER